MDSLVNSLVHSLVGSMVSFLQKDLESIRYIGQGLSGIVYETKWEGERYARKDFPGAERDLFEDEVDALVGLNHPNLGACVGKSIGFSCCSLVQEYVPDNLHNVVQKRKFAGVSPPFEMPEAMGMISQIAGAIMYLHGKSVVHGDLKPNNVLMLDPATSQRIDVKVVDFGLIGTKKRIRLVSKRATYLETFQWKAPELLPELLGCLPEDLDDPFLEYDTDSDSASDDSPSCDACPATERLMKADIYSFGMVCYEILTGELPFSHTSSLNEVKQIVLNSDVRETLKLPKECPAKLKTLVETCWSEEPSNRPSFAEICDALKNVQTDSLEIFPDANMSTPEPSHFSKASLSSTEEREKVQRRSSSDDAGPNQLRPTPPASPEPSSATMPPTRKPSRCPVSFPFRSFVRIYSKCRQKAKYWIHRYMHVRKKSPCMRGPCRTMHTCLLAILILFSSLLTTHKVKP